MALGEERATIVGHDLGRPASHGTAPCCGRTSSVPFALLSVPYIRRSWADIRPTDAMRLMAGKDHFYQLYFQEPGIAEEELEGRRSARPWRIFLLLGFGRPARRRSVGGSCFGESEKFLDSGGAAGDPSPPG